MPSATILRPSVICGDEDRCLNRIAKLSRMLPFVPLVAGGPLAPQTRRAQTAAAAAARARLGTASRSHAACCAQAPPSSSPSTSTTWPRRCSLV
jgi:hypothetical protein